MRGAVSTNPAQTNPGQTDEGHSPIAAASGASGAATLRIESVETALAAYRLSNPVLPFLNLHPALIRVLMFQPHATVIASAEGVRVQDRPLMTAQMKGFLGKAHELNADLALSVSLGEINTPPLSLADPIKL